MKKTLALLLALVMVAALMVPTALADDGMDALIAAAKEEGELTVTAATLTIVTQSGSKEYDGTALTAEGSISGFVNRNAASCAERGSAWSQMARSYASAYHRPRPPPLWP